MRIKRNIKFKAFFLLLVFSFNTLTSFACSLGLDMGYNNGHHNRKEKKENIHSCCEKGKNASGISEEQPAPAEDDDCCTNSVINFQLMAKSVSQIDVNFSAPLFDHDNSIIDLLSSLEQSISDTEFKWAEFRAHLRHSPDIRVSIRSFQI